jgi:transposase-like protein
MNLVDLAQHFSDEDKAREYLEKKRWPDGPICPHCGLLGEAYRLKPTKNGKTHVRKGVWKCAGCRKEFTVTVGTIFADSHIPLHKWLLAYHLLCASKKGMSAHQLHRMLGVTYKTAWFMAHRIRYSMTQEPLSSKLKGVVEVDEVYIGGKFRAAPPIKPGERPQDRLSPVDNKTAVVSMVERSLVKGGKSRVRSRVVGRVTAENLKPVLNEHIESGTTLNTDEAKVYTAFKAEFPDHRVVTHQTKEYARVQDGELVTTNTVEGYFATLKRGINGVYHHVGKQHLHRYLHEFDFRYNSRDIEDGERTELALKGSAGKKLTYRDSAGD